MLGAALKVGLISDRRYLNLYPDPSGPQHDKRKSSIFKYAGMKKRNIVKNATLHESVQKRFELEKVLHYDEMKPYRPESLKDHEVVHKYY